MTTQNIKIKLSTAATKELERAIAAELDSIDGNLDEILQNDDNKETEDKAQNNSGSTEQ